MSLEPFGRVTVPRCWPLAPLGTWLHLNAPCGASAALHILSAPCRPPAPAVLSAALRGPGCATGMGCSVRHCVPGCHLAPRAHIAVLRVGSDEMQGHVLPLPLPLLIPLILHACCPPGLTVLTQGPHRSQAGRRPRPPSLGRFPAQLRGEGAQEAGGSCGFGRDGGFSAGSCQLEAISGAERAAFSGPHTPVAPAGTQPAVPASTWAQRGTVEMLLCQWGVCWSPSSRHSRAALGV